MIRANRTQNFLLAAFIFTGVFASYTSVYWINTGLVVLFFLSSLLTKKTDAYGKIFVVYAVIALLSLGDQIVYILVGEFEFNRNHLTVPAVLLLTVGVQRIRVNYSYDNLVLLNVALLPLLLLLGGVATSGGRITTEYLNANLQGMLVFFGFMVAANKVMDRQGLLWTIPLLAATTIFLVTTGSRQNIILFSVGVVFFLVRIIKASPRHGRMSRTKRFGIAVILVACTIQAMNISYGYLQQRYGSNYDLLQQTIRLSEERDSERSMSSRISFWETSFKTATQYYTGVGHGNIEAAMEKFGNRNYAITKNAHSIMAELLFSVGFAGIALFAVIVWRLVRLLGKTRTFGDHGYVLVFLLLAFLAIPLLANKVFWTLLIVMEKELIESVKHEHGMPART